jgi:hypothetical protein
VATSVAGDSSSPLLEANSDFERGRIRVPGLSLRLLASAMFLSLLVRLAQKRSSGPIRTLLSGRAGDTEMSPDEYCARQAPAAGI